MKVVFISGMLPSGHYSQYLTSGIIAQDDINLIVYADKDQRNLGIKNCGEIRLVWSKSIKYIYQIVKEVMQDKPDVIHIQHEINMFGGTITALLFPMLVFSLRILGYKVVTTIHGVVERSQVNDDFIKLFLKSFWLIKPFSVKIFFTYLFCTISFFSSAVIVHTERLKRILINDYKASKEKVHVILTAIPQKDIIRAEKKKYFLYFGYMVRRKGIGYMLKGFKKFIEANPESEYKLIMAGGVIKGQEQALVDIKKEISENNLEDRVEIRGFIEEEELDKLYREAYAIVIPAKISIAASGPLYHAVSYGKCVIASGVGNFLEEIEDNKTGILVKNDEWYESFDLVVNNPGIVKRIEKNNEQISSARTPLITARVCVDLYKSLFAR